MSFCGFIRDKNGASIFDTLYTPQKSVNNLLTKHRNSTSTLLNISQEFNMVRHCVARRYHVLLPLCALTNQGRCLYTFHLNICPYLSQKK